MKPILDKVCTGCGERKLIEDFSKDSRRLDGIGSRCKKCKSKYDREWRMKNPDKNPRYRKDYYSKNKGKVLEYNTQWALDNPDKKKAHRKKWRSGNPNKKAEYKSRYRARKHSAVQGERLPTCAELVSLYSKPCLVPGCDRMDSTIDHVVPLSKGGANALWNMQPLCRSHNSSKGVKSHDYRDYVVMDLINITEAIEWAKGCDPYVVMDSESR